MTEVNTSRSTAKGTAQTTAGDSEVEVAVEGALGQKEEALMSG